MYNVLPRNSLITIYKSFIRPHLDYGAIIFDQPENESFCKKIESVQYNAALAITGAIQGTSREKLYKELGLETLKSRKWLKKLSYFHWWYIQGIPSNIVLLFCLECKKRYKIRHGFFYLHSSLQVNIYAFCLSIFSTYFFPHSCFQFFLHLLLVKHICFMICV